MLIFCMVAFILKYDDCLFWFFVEKSFRQNAGTCRKYFYEPTFFLPSFCKRSRLLSLWLCLKFTIFVIVGSNSTLTKRYKIQTCGKVYEESRDLQKSLSKCKNFLWSYPFEPTLFRGRRHVQKDVKRVIINILIIKPFYKSE